MKTRQVKMVLLCEDKQHEAFFRRFFGLAGWHARSIRVEKNPSGRGSGEQWVAVQFPKELQELRSRHVSAILVAIIDADKITLKERMNALDRACTKAGIPVRGPNDPVAVFVPQRNIETWIAYLSGENIDERDDYAKLSRERECLESVINLKEMCDRGALRSPSPPSLEAACVEYRAKILPLGR